MFRINISSTEHLQEDFSQAKNNRLHSNLLCVNTCVLQQFRHHSFLHTGQNMLHLADSSIFQHRLGGSCCSLHTCSTPYKGETWEPSSVWLCHPHSVGNKATLFRASLICSQHFTLFTLHLLKVVTFGNRCLLDSSQL